MLHRVEHSHAGPLVVLVHGYTQTHASWLDLAQELAGDHAVEMLDLPGHGGSGSQRLDFEQTAQAIWDCGGADAIYVGYSMGGRLCLRMALDHPVRGLVLIGASPGLANDREREQRRSDDEHLANQIERDGVKSFLDEWLAQPMFAQLRPTPADFTARYANDAQGLAHALRFLGPGAQPPLWERLNELSIPTLFVAGEHDNRYVTVAQEMATRINSRSGVSAKVAIVPNAGHAAHLEQPHDFTRLLRTFLATLP